MYVYEIVYLYNAYYTYTCVRNQCVWSSRSSCFKKTLVLKSEYRIEQLRNKQNGLLFIESHHVLCTQIKAQLVKQSVNIGLVVLEMCTLQ